MSNQKRESQKNLLRRIGYTIGILLIYDLLSYVLIPGVDPRQLAKLASIPALAMISTFSGGGFQNLSLMSMGVGAYISAQIIVQLLQTGVVPKLTEWSKQGKIGRHKLTQLTRYLTVILGFVQAIGIVASLNSLLQFGIVIVDSWWNYLVIGIVLTAGSFIAMWLADQITDKGLGNGISVIITAGIIKKLPNNIQQVYDSLSTTAGTNWGPLIILIVVTAMMAVFIVWYNRCEYRLPIQYSRRENKTSNDSYLPLKLIVPGVVPIIFASSLLSIPQLVMMFFDSKDTAYISSVVNKIFSLSSSVGVTIYGVLIVLFTYLYSIVQVDPERLADNLTKQDAYIPGIWPGDDTAIYIKKRLYDLALPGAAFLSLISIVPLFISNSISPNLQLGLTGSNLLIIVGTLSDIGRQIEGLKLKEGYYDFLSENYAFE